MSHTDCWNKTQLILEFCIQSCKCKQTFLGILVQHSVRVDIHPVKLGLENGNDVKKQQQQLQDAIRLKLAVIIKGD